MKQAAEIINKAIADWNPSHIIVLYSGGYDSLVTAHIAHRVLDRPVYVYSIDTQVSSDGWREYVCSVADSFNWIHDIYDNKAGFNEFVELVREYGCPYTLEGHELVYNRLKDRAIDQMLRDHKSPRPDKPKRWQNARFDKVLFLSGFRKYESKEREELTDPIQRKGSKEKPMNAIFANPLFYWRDEDVIRYRLENDLPTNPFYETTGGSGDCNCGWGNFIKLWQLEDHSPKLAAGNIALVNQVSLEYHGYGWNGKPEDARPQLFTEYKDKGRISPFLCAGCSRGKTPIPGRERAAEAVYLQRELF